MYQKVQLI